MLKVAIPMQPNGLSSCRLKKPSAQSLQRRDVTRVLQEHWPSSSQTRMDETVPAMLQSQSIWFLQKFNHFLNVHIKKTNCCVMCYPRIRADSESACSSRVVCTCCRFCLERVLCICTVRLWVLNRNRQMPRQLRPDRNCNLF